MGGIFKAVGGVVQSLLGMEPPSQPAAPAIEAPPVMPTPNDATVLAAKRKSLAAQSQRQGRMSTILSDATDDPLGG